MRHNHSVDSRIIIVGPSSLLLRKTATALQKEGFWTLEVHLADGSHAPGTTLSSHNSKGSVLSWQQQSYISTYQLIHKISSLTEGAAKIIFALSPKTGAESFLEMSSEDLIFTLENEGRLIFFLIKELISFLAEKQSSHLIFLRLAEAAQGANDLSLALWNMQCSLASSLITSETTLSPSVHILGAKVSSPAQLLRLPPRLWETLIQERSEPWFDLDSELRGEKQETS